MRLYFLRHADAEDGADDAARALSSKGRQQSRQIGRFLEDAEIALDAAYSSPLVRSRQTAELVLEIAGGVPVDKLKLVDALLNETSQKQFEGWLRNLPKAEQVLLVGHAPSLPDRIAALLGLADAAALPLVKGGLVCIDTDDGRSGTLKFYVTPKVLPH